MIKCFDFYGSKRTLNVIVKQIEKFAEQILEKKLRITGEKDAIIISGGNGFKIEICFPLPSRNIEQYQHGLKRMTVHIDFDPKNNLIAQYIEKLSLIFTPEEENNLNDYTPWLKHFVKESYFKQKILSDCLVIFREHSLISVYNIFKLFREMGLKSQNTVYYSKGDRCRNIHRIEESFKEEGSGVYVLSPFESVSKTGKSEDEKITEAAKERVCKELKPYFEKARKEKLKVVVFDDGGLMVTTVVDLFTKEYGDLVYGYIETTKGGMNAIKTRNDMQVTVINLADCAIKNLLNAVIGHSIVQRLREMIPQIGLRGQSVVVVGYGTLGKTIARDLRGQGMAVYVCDNDNERIFEALADGYPVSKDAGNLIEKFKPILVIGCTGLDALTYENLSKIKRDTHVATVSSNEIKQSYGKFDRTSKLDFIDNYARIYFLKSGYKLTILGNGASLNLYNGEGANHSEYQPFLAAMIEAIIYSVVNGPIRTKNGLDTDIANRILSEANILGKYLDLSKSLLE